MPSKPAVEILQDKVPGTGQIDGGPARGRRLDEMVQLKAQAFTWCNFPKLPVSPCRRQSWGGGIDQHIDFG